MAFKALMEAILTQDAMQQTALTSSPPPQSPPAPPQQEGLAPQHPTPRPGAVGPPLANGIATPGSRGVYVPTGRAEPQQRPVHIEQSGRFARIGLRVRKVWGWLRRKAGDAANWALGRSDKEQALNFVGAGAFNIVTPLIVIGVIGVGLVAWTDWNRADAAADVVAAYQQSALETRVEAHQTVADARAAVEEVLKEVEANGGTVTSNERIRDAFERLCAEDPDCGTRLLGFLGDPLDA